MKIVLMTMITKHIEVLERWIDLGIYLKNGIPDKQYTSKMDKKLAMDTDPMGNPRGVGDIDSRGKPRSRL